MACVNRCIPIPTDPRTDDGSTAISLPPGPVVSDESGAGGGPASVPSSFVSFRSSILHFSLFNQPHCGKRTKDLAKLYRFLDVGITCFGNRHSFNLCSRRQRRFPSFSFIFHLGVSHYFRQKISFSRMGPKKIFSMSTKEIKAGDALMPKETSLT